MDPKNKTLIPLIIIFFIFGVAVGYVAHKPETIEKIVEKETIVTVTVTPTPTLPPTPIPTPTPTVPTATTAVSDFIVKDRYDPSKDTPAYTIQFRNFGYVDPNTLSIRQGDSVLIKIADTALVNPMTFILNKSYEKDLGVSGAAFITFNKKGIYTFKGIIRSSDPTITPRTYAEGTISVY